MVLFGCSSEPAAPPAEGLCSEQEDPCPIERLATLNAGTTPLLSLLADDPPPKVRTNCSDWYSNNLCLLWAEQTLQATIVQEVPDLIFLQEMWNQDDCGKADRPAEVSAEPYVCAAGEGSQLERVLPQGYQYACGHSYPDNCIAFRFGTFLPTLPDGSQAACDGNDCSAHMVDIQAECGTDGRLAMMRGLTADGPTILAVVHTNAGIDGDDAVCRSQQILALTQVLLDESSDTVILMGGDFNLDPQKTSSLEDVAAFENMRDELGLTPLPVNTATHLLLSMQLDHLLVRGWSASDSAACGVQSLNPSEKKAVFDHFFVRCGD